MNIVGLGHPGCAMAKIFSGYPEYKIFYMDTEDNDYDGTFIKIEEQESHEQYEANYTSVKLELKDAPIILILSGVGNISGIVLRILEELKDKQISVLYIKPDEISLGVEAKLKHRLTLQVLQQYARSAVFEKIYIVNNMLVEKLVTQLSITKYWDSLNELIVGTHHMMNVYNNIEPLLTTLSPSMIPITARIGTFGLVDYESKEERMFYDLKYPRIKIYYFAINSVELESNKNLLQDIRTFVKAQKKEEKVDVAFSIYSTSYDQNYIYSVHYASLIQEENSNL